MIMKQIVFTFCLLLTLTIFGITVYRYIRFFKLTRKGYPVRNIGRRIWMMIKVAFGQTKIMRQPVLGLVHAMIFWGFCVILIGSIEMTVDGLFASHKAFKQAGLLYDIIMATGDVFALIVLAAVIVFLIRRVFLHVRRFSGIEMKQISHTDAIISLVLILILMITLLGMNTFYVKSSLLSNSSIYGRYPVSEFIANHVETSEPLSISLYEACWWAHILLIFVFANYLPYSKHFHVFMSIPNVFLSRLEPLGKLKIMESITREVKIMLNPETAYSVPETDTSAEAPGRFGVLDIEDVTWKNYFDSLSCTECGRCTASCPANITGKKLSPRKIMMDLRARMKEKGPGLVKEGKGFSDDKSFSGDYISEEELWACTMCNSCAQECPVNIDHPSLIADMRRYLVMEKSAAPAELNAIFANIENNGAPWQFSREDRLKWAEGLGFSIPVLKDAVAAGMQPEFLFWVGSAGSYDDRYKNVSRAMAKILDHFKVSYAVLGTEETSTADAARRAGNEMLYQMQALMIIDLLKKYNVRKIITCDPHVFNTFKNEYPDLDGRFEVIHHTQFIGKLMKNHNIQSHETKLAGRNVTYHDPCYLGRANGEYDAPRRILKEISVKISEMPRNRSFALCCGAGGGQMFKEAEKGNKEVFLERTEEALETGAEIIATACPYCMVMLTDGLKYKNYEEAVRNYDIAELVCMALEL
jgi:Fe-S oxidoreductase/nitrate reductase gamma subunit